MPTTRRSWAATVNRTGFSMLSDMDMVRARTCSHTDVGMHARRMHARWQVFSEPEHQDAAVNLAHELMMFGMRDEALRLERQALKLQSALFGVPL